MSADSDFRADITKALAGFEDSKLSDAARGLFNALGYGSDRTVPIHNVAEFIDALDPDHRINPAERTLLDQLDSLQFLFQLTDTELTSQSDLLSDSGAVENTRIHSYLFFVVELPDGAYTRTFLSGIVRAINRPLPMPALIVFRYGDFISIGIIHRRLHKRDQTKDVLEKVTLIKDINYAEPIRAHLEILNDFSLANLDADFGTTSFVSLHNAWQKRLDSYALSNDFYREIADWYFWAHHQVHDRKIELPRDCDTEEERSLFLIRLLTRLIFCWFLVEKRLLPASLFRQKDLAALLKDFSKDAASYYQAVLQNLFFGTLNMPIEQRGFREKKKNAARYDKNRGITNLWRYGLLFRDYDEAKDVSVPWVTLASKIPFLNGGLFDCLDDKTGSKPNNSILDGFSDNPNESCHLPNDLFFGAERTVDLSKDYGEEDKRTARSKRAKVRGLIEILSRYKFTIEENTPLEEEIALDPELLGKVFENLLASYDEDTRTTARKALGAFYTPREIVSYMVDEALRSYLSTQVPAIPEKELRDLFSAQATPPAIKPAQREALVAAIGRVKIIDPACGSGAFPMGVLHRLVDVLQKLDPNNESWKRDRLAEARRYRELLEEAGADKDEIADCDDRIADIKKSFNTRFHALDFARKLYLIENCIYGVDIQPIATQIAKLRFFISLIVDQKVDAAAPNLGVRPLPNLETRLVAADALIPVEKQSDRASGDLFSGDIDRLRADLARIRHEHFNARDPRKKAKWREADAAKRAELAELLRKGHGLPKDTANKLAQWDPYDQNEHAPFFDPEWMFGIPIGKIRLEGKSPVTLRGNLALINEVGGQTELVPNKVIEIDSGFDVVIGNPPYNATLSAEERSFFKNEYASVHSGRQDTAAIFVEAATRFSNSRGQVVFILPYRLFSRKRNHGQFQTWLLKSHQIAEVLYLGTDVEFTASDEFMVIRVSCGSTSDSKVFVAWKPDLTKPKSEMSFRSIAQSEFISYGEINLNLLRFDRDTLRRIRDTTLELQAVCKVRDGIVPHIREHLVSERKIDSRYVPFAGVAGRYVLEKFYFQHDPLWLCYDINEAKKYISDPVELRKVQLREKEIFLSRKIVTSQNSAILKGSIDEDQTFVSNSIHSTYLLDEQNGGFILEYILAAINSPILNYFHDSLRVKGTDLHPQVLVNNLKKLPIKQASSKQQTTCQALVTYLLALKSAREAQGPGQARRDPLMVAYFEQILNGLVYELYFPDEVHEAGLQLFDLVEAAKLPALNGISEAKRLPHLRQLFEALHDGTHPLKIALQKLQTLDTVRIIEGKA